MATGSVRFWYDAWHDLPQIGGGSDQGVSNQLANMAYTQITNDGLDVALQWMQSLGVDSIWGGEAVYPGVAVEWPDAASGSKERP